jgi:hypothetical protein
VKQQKCSKLGNTHDLIPLAYLVRRIEHIVPIKSEKLTQGFGEQDDFTLIIVDFQALNYAKSQVLNGYFENIS